jgi:polyphosphate kinase
VSENIRVRSIVGRFLEHSRIFYLRNGGDEEIYVGSADLMPRNINRRVEVLFPIENSSLVAQIRDRVLRAYLSDNRKARLMAWDGSYHRAVPGEGEEPVSAQHVLMRSRGH